MLAPYFLRLKNRVLFKVPGEIVKATEKIYMLLKQHGLKICKAKFTVTPYSEEFRSYFKNFNTLFSITDLRTILKSNNLIKF